MWEFQKSVHNNMVAIFLGWWYLKVTMIPFPSLDRRRNLALFPINLATPMVA